MLLRLTGLRSQALIVGLVLALLIPTSAAVAQDEPQDEPQDKPQGPNRSGFSLLLTMGLGLQSNDIFDDSTTGLGGLNLGIGGFLTKDLALMFRFSGTNVQYKSDGTLPDIDAVSGVGGPALQYWLSDFVNLEGGIGYGTVNFDPGGDDSGLGLILGVGLSVFHRGKTSLQFGVEYAPVFLDAGAVHNLGFVFGYQLL